MSLKKLAALPLVEKEKVKLLLGHWSIKAEKFFNPDTAITRIIFLREPVRHFISTYEYIKKTPMHKQHGLANKLSLEDFLEFRVDNRQNNLQLQHLLGIATNMKQGNVDFEQQGELLWEKASYLIDSIDYVFLT